MHIGDPNSNFRRLVIHKASVDAVPDGAGVGDAITFLSSSRSLAKGLTEAAKWVAEAILAVRNAPEPNPWKRSTDEEIATELMRLIEAKKSRSNK